LHDIAIIGAGPYGLSIAAHLTQSGRRFRIFGVPMQTWRERMPAGMRLKSDGFASSLYDPSGEFPFSRFCQDRGIPYSPLGLPVELQAFCDYGLEFQRRYVPMLEPTSVESVNYSRSGFELALSNGEKAEFRDVICAVGVMPYARMAPQALEGLPSSLLSHSSEYGDLSRFAGKTVAVIGGGASATDCAALMAQAGAIAHLLTRREYFIFNDPPGPRTLMERILFPATTIGRGWRSLLCERAPLLFHAMPEEFRVTAIQRHLGPAPCWFMRDAVEGLVTTHFNAQITAASVCDGKVALAITERGVPAALEVDHVIAATGYKVDLRRLTFLGTKLREEIQLVDQAPVLTRNFESSRRGLYFVGPSSAIAFGPLVRFACGAEFTSRRLAGRLT
jgi:Pyridine nucleotide-disulphide oxidoreductase